MGTYFDFKVLIMSRNGYINATKLCQDGGKRFDNWMQNLSSKELVDDLDRFPGIPGDPSTIVIGSGPNEYRGTYVHLELIPHIACWVSTKFARKVSKIVNEYLLKEQKEIIIEKDKIISEQDIENKSLKEMMKEILKDTKHIRKDNKSMKLTINDLTDEVSKLSLDNQITHEMLNVVVEDRVVKPDNKDTTSSIVIYESIDQGPNMFYIFRVQKRGLKAALKRYKAIIQMPLSFMK
jgi:hypothetical protein